MSNYYCPECNSSYAEEKWNNRNPRYQLPRDLGADLICPGCDYLLDGDDIEAH